MGSRFNAKFDAKQELHNQLATVMTNASKSAFAPALEGLLHAAEKHWRDAMELGDESALQWCILSKSIRDAHLAAQQMR